MAHLRIPRSWELPERLATPEDVYTFWNVLQPREYGFYSNVNPQKPHPRWSQEIETDSGTGERRPTLLYNGYGDQVGSLYSGEEA